MERQDTRTASTSIRIRLFGAIGFGLFGFSILFIIYYGAIDDSFSMIRNVSGFIGALMSIIIIRLQSKSPLSTISAIKFASFSFFGVLVGTTLMTILAVVFYIGGPLSIAVSEGLGAGVGLGLFLIPALLLLHNSFKLFNSVINGGRKEHS